MNSLNSANDFSESFFINSPPLYFSCAFTNKEIITLSFIVLWLAQSFWLQTFVIKLNALIAGSLESAYSLIRGVHEILGKGEGETLALLWLVDLINKEVNGEKLALRMGSWELTISASAESNMERSVERSTERSVERSTERSTERSVERSMEMYTESSMERIAERSEERSAEFEAYFELIPIMGSW